MCLELERLQERQFRTVASGAAGDAVNGAHSRGIAPVLPAVKAPLLAEAGLPAGTDRHKAPPSV